MRTIKKGSEPASLTTHREWEHSDYYNYPDKDALRYALITEQGGICCYCMGRIYKGPKTMKIEHWRSKSLYPAKQLEYQNLLGACLGGEGKLRSQQHCDTRKSNQDLLWNPANPDHHIETQLRYEDNGSIRSDEDKFNSQIEDILNLNLTFLKNNRKSVLSAILDWWDARVRHLPKSQQRRLLENNRNRQVADTGELAPYCQVTVWWLDQKLAEKTL